ncbi:hypothetical protein V1478_015132, partial [Vespula squamosa]
GHREEARYPWNLGYASPQRVRPVLRSYEEESFDTRYKTTTSLCIPSTLSMASPRVYDNDSDASTHYVGSSRSRLPSMSRHCDRSIEVKVVVRAVGTPHLCSSVREEGRRDGRSRCCCIWRTEKEGKMAAGISALSTTDSVVNNVSPWRRSRRLESWQTVRYLRGRNPISKRFYKRGERAFWRIHPVHTRISYLLTIGTSIAGGGREDEKEEEEEKEEEVEKEEVQCEFTFR